jgi:hypothetical protein
LHGPKRKPARASAQDCRFCKLFGALARISHQSLSAEGESPTLCHPEEDRRGPDVVDGNPGGVSKYFGALGVPDAGDMYAASPAADGDGGAASPVVWHCGS